VVLRCPDCGWRGWAVDREPTNTSVAAVEPIPEPPNLRDSPLARTERADIRLEELDRIE
jgi:hypothetical protein